MSDHDRFVAEISRRLMCGEPVEVALRDYIKDYSKRRYRISFDVTSDDCASEMSRMIEEIGKRAGTGHSFDIIVDPDNPVTFADDPDSGKPQKFFIDGDGADHIVRESIKVEELMTDDSLSEEQINAIRSVEASESKSLNKKHRGEVSFQGRTYQVFTVNGRNARKRVSDGGQGCQEFVGGMNGAAAQEPQYHATEWCGPEELCVNELMDPVSFLCFVVHEAAEDYGMTVVGESYDDAHDGWADPWEDAVNHLLETEEWDFGEQPEAWLKLVPELLARVSL